MNGSAVMSHNSNRVLQEKVPVAMPNNRVYVRSHNQLSPSTPSVNYPIVWVNINQEGELHSNIAVSELALVTKEVTAQIVACREK